MECACCGNSFPSAVVIDGKRRNLANRKYCFDCSPFGGHNTRRFGSTVPRYCVHCGEKDPSKFYGHKKHICGGCHNKYTVHKGRELRLRAVEWLGGKCVECGYKHYTCSLDIHHLDPSKKDPKFSGMRGWAWDRIENELVHCVLLCKNCHAAVHAGHIVLGV